MMSFGKKKREFRGERVERRKMPFCNLSTHRITAGIAHDLNNLLMAITCNLEFVLAQTDKDGPVYDELASVAHAAEIAANLSMHLMAVNLTETEAQVLDANTIVRESAAMVRRMVNSGIDLRVELASETAPIKVRPDQIHRMLLNLVLNACEAMGREGVLTLATENVIIEEAPNEWHSNSDEKGEHKTQNYVKIRVADSGSGMEPEVRARALEPFFTRTEANKGHGVGLSQVDEIIRKNRGHIAIQSEPGVGTIFEVFLPAAKS